MSLLDKVPGELALYIGGMFSLRCKEALRESGITHVLSALRLPLDPDLFANFTHHVVEVDDVDDENLLEHFPACIRFIQAGLDSGGAVLVHCAMGKSRSATVVCAYLMYHYGVSAAQALEQLRQARPFCEPNEGFMAQLELYEKMQRPTEVEDQPAYQRWLYQREVEFSRACGQAPEAEKIRFEDEHVSGDVADGADYELRCRKCRRPLATSRFVLDHTRSLAKEDGPITRTPLSSATSGCAHFFLDPLSWMRAELENGKLDGRLECPKCRTNVGKYAWQGMQCSCGAWVVPAISIAKARVDIARAHGSAGGAAMGIRMPPGQQLQSQQQRQQRQQQPPPSTSRRIGQENL